MTKFEERKHPSIGKAIKLTDGPYKDKYFVVVNYLTTQFQGKDIAKIGKAHPDLAGVRDLHKRKLLDNDAVYGRLYPSMEFVVVHDSDMLIKEEKPKKGLKLVKGDKDDTGETVGGDSTDNSTGGDTGGDEGRGDTGEEEMESVPSPFKESPDESGTEGSGDSGPEEESKGPDKPEAKSGTRKPRASKKK